MRSALREKISREPSPVSASPEGFAQQSVPRTSVRGKITPGEEPAKKLDAKPSVELPLLVHPRSFQAVLEGGSPTHVETTKLAVPRDDRQALAAAHVSTLTVQHTSSEIHVEGLGRVTVEAKLDHGAVDLAVRVERPETVEIVKSHAGAISDDLRAAQIPLKHALSVTSSSAQSGYDGQAGDPSRHRRPQTPERDEEAEYEARTRKPGSKERVRFVL